MTNLRWIAHLYTTPLCATVYRQREIWKAADHAGPLETVLLPSALLEEKAWRNAANMVNRIRRAIVDDIAINRTPVVLGETLAVQIERLSPESVMPWESFSAATSKRLHLRLALESNPAALLSCGGQTVHMEVGALWWLNVTALHSLQNWGKHSVINMVAEFAIEEGT